MKKAVKKDKILRGKKKFNQDFDKKKLDVEEKIGITEQSIYAYLRQTPTHKADAAANSVDTNVEHH